MNRKNAKTNNGFILNTLLATISVILVVSISIAVCAAVYHSALKNSRWPPGSYRYNQSIGFEMTPGFSSTMLDNSFYVKTHELGYRIPDFEDSTTIKKGGVLALGCSYTFGDEVNAEDTFSWQTAQMLNLPAYNYGVCSYSYASCIIQLRELKKKGLLKKLQPSVIILGAGSWLFKRSLNPFYPTHGPQFAYSYISKNDTGLKIVQPPDIFSTQHLYNLTEYYTGNSPENIFATLNQFTAICSIVPRAIIAEIQHKLHKIKLDSNKHKISREELYEFVLNDIHKITTQSGAKLVILWMPYRRSDTADEAMLSTIKKFKDITFVNGRESLTKHNIPESEYRHRHPGALAHKAYATEITSALSTR